MINLPEHIKEDLKKLNKKDKIVIYFDDKFHSTLAINFKGKGKFSKEDYQKVREKVLISLQNYWQDKKKLNLENIIEVHSKDGSILKATDKPPKYLVK